MTKNFKANNCRGTAVEYTGIFHQHSSVNIALLQAWERSGRVLDSRLRVRASPASLPCGP